jgi:hypothetical protein
MTAGEQPDLAHEEVVHGREPAVELLVEVERVAPVQAGATDAHPGLHVLGPVVLRDGLLGVGDDLVQAELRGARGHVLERMDPAARRKEVQREQG